METFTLSVRKPTHLYASVDISSLNGTSENGPNIGDTYKLLDSFGNFDNELRELSKVNIFVGPNNSGKSRFMRKLFSSSQDQIRPASMDTEALTDTVAQAHTKITQYLKNQMIELEGGIPEPPHWSYLKTDIPVSQSYDEYRNHMLGRALRAMPQRRSGPFLDPPMVESTRSFFLSSLESADKMIEAEQKTNFRAPKVKKSTFQP